MNQFITQTYNIRNPFHTHVVFLDRDGTIIKSKDYLSKESQVEFFPGVAKSIKKLNEKNVLVVLVTNQPVVALGKTSIQGVKKINDFIVKQLQKSDAIISIVNSCPHHPQANVANYKIKCKCRKPGTLMFEEVLTEYNIQRENAFIIGDSTRDINAGNKLRILSFLVLTGMGGHDNAYAMKPDYICKDIGEAIETVLTKL